MHDTAGSTTCARNSIFGKTNHVHRRHSYDLFLAEWNLNGDIFTFVRSCLLPILQPFNWTNPHSVVILDNASIHHVDVISEIIEDQAGAKPLFLSSYSPDLNPVEEIFSKVKSIVTLFSSDQHSKSIAHTFICNGDKWRSYIIYHSFRLTQCNSTEIKDCNLLCSYIHYITVHAKFI